MALGGALLYRVYRRRGMVMTDFSKKHDGMMSRDDDDAEAASLLSSNLHKGGIGSEIVHLPLRYKDSYLLPTRLNPIINEYIRQAEYAMSVAVFLSGLLTLTLEKHNFKKFDDHYKIPIYLLIGSSLAFLITYALFDIIESTQLFTSWGRSENRTLAHPAILTNMLHLTIISMSCIMGGGLGIIYGVNDIEGLFSTSLRLVYLETYREILSMLPIGLVIGICFGFIYGLLRALELHLMPDTPTEASSEL